jgi:hypothetical protein
MNIVYLLKELSTLLTPEDKESLNFPSLVNKASELIPTKMLNNKSQIWNSLLKSFYNMSTQTIRYAASNLHTNLGSSVNSPETILQVFRVYPHLFSKPATISEFGGELIDTLNHIATKISMLQEEEERS